MKIRLLFIISLTCAGNLFASSPLTVSPKYVSFEKVKQGETKSSKITITNNSKKTVKIINIRSSCYCITVDNFRRNTELDPNEKKSIDIIFDSTNKRIGSAHYFLNIRTDDKKSPVTKLNILTLVEERNYPGLEITPYTLDFGNISHKENKVLSIHIFNPGPKQYKILGVDKITGLDIKVPINRTIRKNESMIIPVKIEPWVRGSFYRTVTIRTDDPATPAFHCRVKVRIKKPTPKF